MNFIDILILIVLIYGLVKGVIRGFVLQFFSLLGVILGVYIAKAYVGNLAGLMCDWFSIALVYARPLSYFVLFCVIILSFHLLAKLLDKSIKVSLVNWLNKLMGALLGLLKYALVLSILLNVYQSLDKKERVLKPEKKNASLLYKPLVKIVPKIMPYVYSNFLNESK